MPLASIFACVSALCAGGLALAAAFRAGRSIPRWAFAGGMTVLAAESIFAGLSATATSPTAMMQWQFARHVAISFVPGTWLLFSLTYARGNGRDFVVGARFALAALFILPPANLIFRRHIFVEWASAAGILRLNWGGFGLYVLQLVAAVWVVMNLERTFRASVGTIRWRIKFMLLGVGVLFVARVYTSSQVLVFRGIDPGVDSINAAGLIVGSVLILRSFSRAGHFDLDVYPSHSVLQNSLSVLLAGVYLLIVGVFAKVVTQVGGDDAFALKALVVLVSIVALAVVFQSDRARLWLRKFVSRHFRRPLYDYRRIWQKFTDATVSRVEQRDLARSIAALIADVFQALSVGIWLVNDKRDSLLLEISTSNRGGSSATTNAGSLPAADLIAWLQSHPDPIDLDTAREPWAESLRGHHPKIFPNGGDRACVPLLCRGELLGIILIGDRVGGGPFSVEDGDMLKCIADHAAASLMNVRLAESLLQLRQLEAFQSMAAFFVHDLKNAASTLTLMLQNLRVHFDNPAFRADALRAIASTTEHINRLISRLSVLRHELKIELSDADLNDVVTNALAGLQNAPGPTLVREMRPLPRISLDPEQLKKVVINLILNATEAVPRDGRIRISTGQQDGWVVLTVNDNGCGMTNDFVAQSLFRPFQTTKKNGLGIGMFQSKMIVEAHGGKITVASEPGKGTTFQVLLRAPSDAAQQARRHEPVHERAVSIPSFFPAATPGRPSS